MNYQDFFNPGSAIVASVIILGIALSIVEHYSKRRLRVYRFKNDLLGTNTVRASSMIEAWEMYARKTGSSSSVLRQSTTIEKMPKARLFAFSNERTVVHISAKTPRKAWRKFAGGMGYTVKESKKLADMEEVIL